MKKWEEAEKDASKAIEMDPKNAKVITNCCWVNAIGIYFHSSIKLAFFNIALFKIAQPYSMVFKMIIVDYCPIRVV